MKKYILLFVFATSLFACNFENTQQDNTEKYNMND